MDLLKFKELIGSNGMGGILITLEDGRCACVDILRNGVVIEILLDAFLKWTDFDVATTKQDLEDVERVLKNPDWIKHGPFAKDYLTDENIKIDFDRIKQESGHKY